MEGRFSDAGVLTLDEVLGNAPEVKADGERCSYCERGWGNGFTACPQCGLKEPPRCDDCGTWLEGGACPECAVKVNNGEVTR